jgi:hypothetical protein
MVYAGIIKPCGVCKQNQASHQQAAGLTLYAGISKLRTSKQLALRDMQAVANLAPASSWPHVRCRQ